MVAVVAEDLALVGPARPVPGEAMPRQLARGQDAEALVVGLEEEAPVVEQVVCPGSPIAGDAGVEHEVVVSTRHLERIELQRAETVDDRENALLGVRQRSRRGEEVTDDEESARDGGGQWARGGHGEDRSRSSRGDGRVARPVEPTRTPIRAGPSARPRFFADPISLRRVNTLHGANDLPEVPAPYDSRVDPDREAAVERVIAAFEKMMHRVATAHAPEFLEVGVTMSQAKVLYLVQAAPGLRMSDLSARLGVSLSTVSGVVDRLVDQGLLERRTTPLIVATWSFG